MSPIPKREFKVQSPEDQGQSDLPGLEIFSQGPAFAPPRRGGGIEISQGQIKMGAFTLTDRGLQVDGNGSRDDWSKIGDVLFKLEGSIQWLIGDWLAYGEDVKWGEIPEIAIRLDRLPSTLHDYAYVSRRVQFSFRKENLSYTHHTIVAPLVPEKQQHALDYAVEHNLSVAKFRQWVNQGMPADVVPQVKAALPTHTDPDREAFYEAYISESNRFFFGVDRLEDLPEEHRKEAAQRSQWLSDFYAAAAKELKG